MTDGPPEDSGAHAVERIAAARNLIARQRYREALDLLNSAIPLAPAEPRAFMLRAETFEALGMTPQADADRERARQLADSQGVSYEALEQELAAAPEPRRPRPAARAYRRQRGPALSESVIIVAFILFLIGAVAGGSYIILRSLDISLSSGGNGGAAVAQPTPSPTPVQSVSPSGLKPTPSPTLPPGSNAGSPYTLASLQRAWQAKGLTVTVGGGSVGFTGFKVAPTAVTLSRAGETARVAVLVYKDADAPQQDWNLVVGQRPEPKPGHTLPAHFSVWWNANILVVAIDAPSAIGADALDGVLGLTS